MRKTERITLSSYLQKASTPRDGKFPLSYVESDILAGEMPILRVQSGESKKYNFVANPKSENGTVNLGIVDGYFHQILEFIPMLIKFPSMRFILNSQSPEELRRLFDFFDICYIEKHEDDSNELTKYEWSKYGKYNYIYYRKSLTVYPDEESVLTVRNAILKKINPTKLDTTTKKILYVSRNADTKSRKVVNEEMLLKRLRKSNYQLQVITPSRMKLKDCFREFVQADVIIGPHGGGLSNIVLAKKESLVIELNKDFDVRWHFYRISRILGVQHRLAIIESFEDDSMFLSNWDIERVESIIHDWEMNTI